MNQHIARLYEIAGKPSRRIIGLMSGTSLDGLDVALCQITGSGVDTNVRIEQFETIPYQEDLKATIRQIFAKQHIDFQHLVVLNEYLGTFHGTLIRECLQRWTIPAEEIDCIASHGQTVFHAPRHQHQLPQWPNATLQIGDGDHLAVSTGIITLSDFRQKHLAAGGEGAPVAVYGDYLLFSKPGENRLMLNMGGIANFTYLPASAAAQEVFVTDTGPGNTLLDAFTQEYFQHPYDADARFARLGEVQPELLKELKSLSFFKAPFPKTTGPEVFNKAYVRRCQEATHTENLSGEDLLATLTAFSAETIVEALDTVMQPGETYHLYASGGGYHNPLLMEHIQNRLPGVTIQSSETLGVPADAKEAVLFAVLANETLAGGKTHYGDRPNVPSVTMGKISLPG